MRGIRVWRSSKRSLSLALSLDLSLSLSPSLSLSGPRGGRSFFSYERGNPVMALFCWRLSRQGPSSTLTLSHSHSHTLTLSLSLSLSHSHTLALTLSHSHTLTLSHSHTRNLTLRLTLTLSQGPLGDAHLANEEYCKKAGLGLTSVRPTSFHTNFVRNTLKPSTLSPQPSTLSPKFQTLRPKF